MGGGSHEVPRPLRRRPSQHEMGVPLLWLLNLPHVHRNRCLCSATLRTSFAMRYLPASTIYLITSSNTIFEYLKFKCGIYLKFNDIPKTKMGKVEAGLGVQMQTWVQQLFCPPLFAECWHWGSLSLDQAASALSYMC